MSRPVYIALTLILFAVAMAGVAFALKWAAPLAVDWLADRIGIKATLALILGPCIVGWAGAVWHIQRGKTAR